MILRIIKKNKRDNNSNIYNIYRKLNENFESKIYKTISYKNYVIYMNVIIDV